MIIQCSHIDKAFGTDVILSDVSFHVNEQEKCAVVGINGSGKTTLLKIIMGELLADSGEVITAKDNTIGYLAQNQDIHSSRTIYEEMLDAKKEIIQMETDMRCLEQDMKHASGEKLESMMKQYSNLTHAYEMANGYAYKSELTGILKGLGFTEEDYEKPISTLSGGQKTRVALGKMLLATPDLIILDEPTNHLDLGSIRWLETYLATYKGAVILVAHDRYFLDKIVTKVVEIERGNARTYMGNYSDYAIKKQAVYNDMMKQYANQQQAIKHQEEVIAKLRSFNREKSIKRAESRQKMLDKMERIDKPVMEDAKMKITLSPRIQSGNDVLTVEGLSKSFGNNHLFSNLSFSIKRGERIAIMGDNGTGKTTILKIINGITDADSGEIKTGTNVSIAYYDQEHQVLHPDKTVFEELQDAYPEMNNTEVRGILAAFLFTGDDAFKLVRELSGGEKGRISLAKLMLSNANFLILDEPTNHLDMVSKQILENALNQYEGTVLYVSHDRYFINQTATRILDLTQGMLLNYIGNYDYYLEKKEEVERAGFAALTANSNNSSDDGITVPEVSDTKLSWQQQKEEQARERKRANALKKVEDEIAGLEDKAASLEEALSDPSIGTDLGKLMELNNKKAEIDTRLEELMEEWEVLSSQ